MSVRPFIENYLNVAIYFRRWQPRVSELEAREKGDEKGEEGGKEKEKWTNDEAKRNSARRIQENAKTTNNDGGSFLLYLTSSMLYLFFNSFFRSFSRGQRRSVIFYRPNSLAHLWVSVREKPIPRENIHAWNKLIVRAHTFTYIFIRTFTLFFSSYVPSRVE